MNNLLEKLQPKEEFALLKKRKPIAHRKITKALKKSNFWHELSREDSELLCKSFGYEDFSMSAVINLFKPVKE